MHTFVLATRNAGKIVEFRTLLSRFGEMEIMGLDSFPDLPEIEETGATFAENALIKAQAVAKATGCLALADDSGLEVDALGGAPGVYSARYSAEPGHVATDRRNNEKLLNELSAVPDACRTARFICAIAACLPDGRHMLAEGVWAGIIGWEAKGANGFGYDPLFTDPETGLRAAELTPAEKNVRSHRARAVKELARQWPEFMRQCRA